MELTQHGSNQTELKLNDWYVFFSYKTPVVAIDRCNDTVYVTEKKWSRTTSRHINNYLKTLVYPEDFKLCAQAFLDDLVK